jgi:enterochelin esterase family protein
MQAQRMVFVGLMLWAGAMLAMPAQSQVPAATAPGPVNCQTRSGPMAPPMSYKSVEQLPDSRLTFRICAPNANTVVVTSPDIAAIPSGYPAGTPAGLAMTRDDRGIWSATTAVPVVPGNYRFSYQVDGVRTPDPQGTTYSEHQSGISSTVEVKGAAGDFQTWQPSIPHGAVETIFYWSKSLQAVRRAHIYTPPGYTNGNRKYPVLYLVHGAGDSDDCWTSIGHANNILDNQLAAKQTVPMIVVMPFGHTPPRPGSDAMRGMLVNQDFGDDLIKDLIPYVDANYRTLRKADMRAMAGLSMGGAHTLNFGVPHPELFRYVGIFSMGLGFNNANPVSNYTQANDAALKLAAKQLKLVYYAIGREDFLYSSAAPTRQMFDQYGIKYTFHESGGGHTWMNWRDYLADFAPRLFH